MPDSLGNLSGIFTAFLVSPPKKVWWIWKRGNTGKLTRTGYCSVSEEAIGAQKKGEDFTLKL